MPKIAPTFVDAHGRSHRDALDAAGERPRISLDTIASVFNNISLFGEITPGSYFQGVELREPKITAYSGHSRSWAESFSDAVVRCCGDDETIAVQFSGGLDSLAVLYHVNRLKERRKIIAITGDTLDDYGVSTAVVAQKQIEALDIKCTHIVFDVFDCNNWPDWDCHGPSRTVSPSILHRMSSIALDHGANVIVDGDGADELVAAHRFATIPLARKKSLKAAYRYFRDASLSDVGWLGEVLAISTSVFPAKLRMKCYWSVNMPEWCEALPSRFLTPNYKDVSRQWAADWIKAALAEHAKRDRDWCDAEAHDSWWPQPYISPASNSLREDSIFLDEEFVAYALSRPPTDRYDHRYPEPYQRLKSAVVELFDEEHRPILPKHKQYFTSFVRKATERTFKVDTLADLGIVNPDLVAQEKDETALIMLEATDKWVRQSLERGVSA